MIVVDSESLKEVLFEFEPEGETYQDFHIYNINIIIIIIIIIVVVVVCCCSN